MELLDIRGFMGTVSRHEFVFDSSIYTPSGTFKMALFRLLVCLRSVGDVHARAARARCARKNKNMIRGDRKSGVWGKSV